MANPTISRHQHIHTPTQLPVNGLVLSGGHSTRMGKDKSLIAYHGKPQGEFLFDLLGECCDQVYTSCRSEQNVPPHLNPVVDRYDVPGPVNGILSALAFMPHLSWLIVAVDMPFVNGPTLQLLISGRDGNKLATCFHNPASGQPEPLLTLWEAHAYPHLQSFVENGNISPRGFLKTHPVKLIEPPDEKTLLNVNYPDVSDGW